jgi:hypothetical protein
LTKAATRAEIGIPAWLEGRPHKRRRGGVPPRLEVRGVQRGGEAASSPGWPLADVQASVKGARRCDVEGGGAGRGRRTARRRGSRGSRGRRRAWLPQVRLLLAGGSGFAAGGAAPASRRAAQLRAPPPSPLLLLLRLRVGEQGSGSPERLGLGRAKGGGGGYLKRRWRGARGRRGCAGRSRGASRRRP